MLKAKQTGVSVVDLKITQPSGMDLIVNVERNDSEFISASVDGPIDILFDGPMHIEKEPRPSQTLSKTNG